MSAELSVQRTIALPNLPDPVKYERRRLLRLSTGELMIYAEGDENPSAEKNQPFARRYMLAEDGSFSSAQTLESPWFEEHDCAGERRCKRLVDTPPKAPPESPWGTRLLDASLRRPAGSPAHR